MSTFLRSIVRNFRQSSNSLKPPKNFLGKFMQDMAEISDQELVANASPPKSYFKEPLAGNLSSFYSTTDQPQNKSESNTDDTTKKQEQDPIDEKKNEFQASKCSVPFMVFLNSPMNF